MHSKFVLSALFLLTLTTSLCAQTTIGVEGGLSYNSFHTNIANRTSTQLEAAVGYNFAIPVQYHIRSWLYATAIPGIAQKGYSQNRTDSLSGEYDRHANTYIQLPVGAGFTHALGRLRIDLALGGYAAYWLSGRLKGSTADIFATSNNGSSQQFQLTPYDQRYVFNPRRDNRWEEGWWIAPELQYRLADRWWLSGNARYYQSLSSQNKAPISSIPAYNRTWILSIGCNSYLIKSKSRL